jgi:prepilin-type N-terminal cleavage/methylation domain-containing protein
MNEHHDSHDDLRIGARWPFSVSGLSAGFTLVELLISLTVSAALFAGVAQFMMTQRTGLATRQQVATMQQNARDGIDFLTNELTMTGFDPTACGCTGIVAATASTFQFTQDLEADGDTDGPGETVTYGLYDEGGDDDLDLGRDTGNGFELVAENLTALAFLYTLADGTTTATPALADLSQIRTVDITLTARTARPDPQYAAHGGYRTQQLTASVKFRNLGV